MNIIVTIKQVPESSNVKMDPETGTMLRTTAEAVINPLDTNAIEAALRLRDEYGKTNCTIYALSALRTRRRSFRCCAGWQMGQCLLR